MAILTSINPRMVKQFRFCMDKKYPQLVSGIEVYLVTVHTVYSPPGPEGYCKRATFVLFSAVQCSAYIIISMTFERFYSVLRPHKAAAFNTMKRAKVSLVLITFVSIIMNVPHIFTGTVSEWQCVPYGKVIGKWYGELYYWTSFCVNFVVPFVFLMIMNLYIIFAICRRATLFQRKSESNNNGNTIAATSQVKNTEMQAVVTLLAVSFVFLLFTTPTYMLFLCVLVVDFTSTPFKVAQFHIFYHCAQKLYYTNHGINILFYVLSGKKFRSDLKAILTCRKESTNTPDKGTSSTGLSGVSHVQGN